MVLRIWEEAALQFSKHIRARPHFRFAHRDDQTLVVAVLESVHQTHQMGPMVLHIVR